MKDDHCGSQGGQWDIQAAAGGRGFQLLGEVLQISIRGVAEELEEVIVKAVGVCAVNDEVGNGEHFEQETGSLALFGTVSEQPLCINDHQIVDGVKCCPHAHRAGLLCGRGLENFSAHEECVIQGVRFAFSCVAEDGHHLQQLVGVAAQIFYKGGFVLYLWRKQCLEEIMQLQNIQSKKRIQFCELCAAHLHFLILINQEKTGDLFQHFYSLRFDLISYVDRCLHRVDYSRLWWWRVRCKLVFLLIASTVCAFLTVLAQVNFAGLATDHGSVAFAIVSISFSFTVVTVRNMTGSYLNPLMVLQTFLTVDLTLASNTLQALAFITLNCSLLKATTGITLLTY